ncbi:MAG: M3 family metallopeptidase [Candidatus Zixiibacteriota bacterium]
MLRYTLAILLTLLCQPILAQDNPLLVTPKTLYQTPPFNLIKNSDYLPAVQEGIKQQQAEIDAIIANPAPATFKNTIEPFDLSGQTLSTVNGVFYSLLGTMNSPEMQQLAEQLSPLLTTHQDGIWLNEKLFARIKQVYDKRASAGLAPNQIFLLEHLYHNFIKSGALLDSAQKARLREINNESSLLGLKYHNNTLAETNNSYIVIDNKADLAGLPDNIIALGAEEAAARSMPGKWVYTAQRPSWTPFLQYSTNRELRKKLYTAYFMRCNRDNDNDNKAIVQKLMSLREESCKLLGYATPADFFLEDHMAGSARVVDSFLWSLWTPSLNRAKAELVEMQAIADSEHAGIKIESWDWWYYAEKLRKAKYDIDDAALRPYFSQENVEKGMFTLAQKLYGLKFVERKDIPIYHPEVKVYEVQESSGKLLGLLYTDLFPRESKGSGAWSGAFRGTFIKDGQRVLPLSTLVCNSSKPTADTPSLMSMDDFLTVFHEFGHCLNTLLSASVYREDYTEQDAGELPSQFMENFALEPEMLKLYARHYKTGEVIPAELVARLKNSHLFNKGFESVEYLANCFLDMAWHELPDAKNVNVTDFEKAAMDRIGLIPEIVPRYHTVYFGHMMGGYSAGYYGYDWAGVLDADAFQAFKETSLFDRKTASLFRKYILEKLGSESAMSLYQKFRGKPPQVEPFLRRIGAL